MEMTALKVEAEGWVRFEENGLRFRVRFREAADGRIEPVGVDFEDVVLSNRVLSKIPFGRIEARGNLPDIASAIRVQTGQAV